MHYYHWTLNRIKEANRQAGQHWFAPDTMRFFKSRVGCKIYQGEGGVYFVSSERFEASNGYRAERCFTVREFHPTDKSIDTPHGEPFNEHTRAVAHSRARKYADGTLQATPVRYEQHNAS